MTGFIRGLFSSKPTERVEQAAPEKKAAPKQESGAFFLDMSEARTLGNSEYMQTAKTIRRTFARTVDQPEEMELVQQVSATDRVVEGQPESTMVSPFSSGAAAADPEAKPPADSPVAERRKADSSMDMFRNMARNIKK